MRTDICRFALLTPVLLASLVARAWIGGVTTQKFIGHGWDTLRSSPEEALAHAAEFDRTGLDGITVCLGGKTAAGAKYNFTTIMTDAPWDYAALEPRLAALSKFKEHPGLRESFLMFWLAPQTRLAWDDDVTWQNFATNVGVLAKLGAAAGMKGYFVDGEDYPKTKQFAYDSAKDAMDYPAACKLARRRGAEVFGALFREHPDATLLSFWFLSLSPGYAPLRNPVAQMKESGDLWPAFVNGLLDVMPAAATFVDGDEHAYNYDSAKKDFYTKSLIQRQTALGLVAKKNRAKYAAQLSVGFGLYLDLYKTPGDLARFERNLVQAAEVSTEYVWIYGEQHNWVGWNKLGDKTWEEAMPGLSDVLVSIKDPENYRVRRLAELKARGEADNLIRNLKDGFWTWKDDKLPTTFASDETKWTIRGGSGCVLAGVPAKEGELYAVSVAGRGANVRADVHWRRKGAFDWDKPEFPIFLGEPDKDGWRRGAVAARVPVDVDELVVQCGADPKGEATAEFAEFSVIRLVPHDGGGMVRYVPAGADDVGLEKNGTGTWAMAGTNDFAGPVTVNAGTLRFVETKLPYRWYRFNVKALENGREMLVGYYFALYDRDGRPLTDGFARGASPETLAAGEACFWGANNDFAVDAVSVYGNDLDRFFTFDGNCWGGYFIKSRTPWETWKPAPDDEASWARVVLRLPDDAAPAVAYDFVRDGGLEWRCPNGIATWSLDASVDGRSWVEVSATMTRPPVVGAWGRYWAGSGAGPVDFGNAIHPNGLPVAAFVPASTPPKTRAWSVAHDATLVNEYETPLTVSRLTVDATRGVGAFVNFAFAASGVLDICNLAFENGERVRSFTGDFARSSGFAENVPNWTVTVNGASPETCSVVVCGSTITVTRKSGMVIRLS